jgi:hypothetical protein
MKTKRTLTITTVLVALATFTTLGVLRGTRQVHAQDQVPPPTNDRISFGMVGITRGQIARLNVTNPGETQEVIIHFRLVDSNGEVLRRNNGQPIERTMTLEPGHSAFLQVSADNLLGREDRLNLRAEVTIGCPCQLPATLEVVNNGTGRTEWVLSGEHFRASPPVGQ